MIQIPNAQSKKHSQLNTDEFSGTIYQSRNITLDDGYISVAERSYAQMTTDDDADLETADAVLASNSEIFVNSDEVFSGTMRFDSSFSNRSGNTNHPTPGVEEDVVYFNNTEVVSDGSDILYRSASTTWTAVSVSGSGFSTSNPTAMTVFSARNNLAVGNSNIVKFINTSWAVSGTILTLPNGYQVSSLVSAGSQLFIFTRSTYGGESRVFIVGAIQATADYSYGVGTFEVFSGVAFKSSVVGMDSLGRLIRFTGGGFEKIAQLPIYSSKVEWADALNDYSRVSNRGLSVDGDLIFVSVSSEVNGGVIQNLPNFSSGVWCYDSTNGSFYHRYSPSYTRIQNISGTNITVNTTDNNFTLTSGNLNKVITGMIVMFDDGSSPVIPDIKQSTQYFIIKDSSTVFRLATTYANAIAGTAIDITGTGNTSQSFYIFLENDYGWTYHDNRSAVAVLNNKLFNSGETGRIVMTGEVFAKQSTTAKTAICGICPFVENRSYIITPKIFANGVTDSYNAISFKFKPLNSGEKILIKYKTTDRYGVPFSSVKHTTIANWKGTWTDTNTFTTTQDLSSAVVGDEIEIIAGVGSGHMAHIESISSNAGTYTVNLTEAYPFAVVNDIFYFNVDNFILFDTIDSTNTLNYYLKSIGSQGAFIQLKIEMRGVGVGIKDVRIDNKESIKSNT